MFYAVNIMDRYLANLVPRDEVSPCLVQLSLTCLIIAAKLEEEAGRRLRIDTYIKHIKDRFNVHLEKQDLLSQEMRILKSLMFDIRYDSPLFFLERLIHIFELDVM